MRRPLLFASLLLVISLLAACSDSATFAPTNPESPRLNTEDAPSDTSAAFRGGQVFGSGN